MPTSKMPVAIENRLDAVFEQLRQRLLSPTGLDPAQSDPIFYLIFPPNQALTVRKLLPGWIARLQSDRWEVNIVSLGKLIWDLVEKSGRWEEWLDLEGDAEPQEVNDSIRNVLRTNNALVDRVAELVSVEKEGTLVLVTDVEMLHPFFRLRAIENYLNNKVRVPTIFLYPGRRAGQYGLHFLEFYPEDSGYRSPMFGGLE